MATLYCDLENGNDNYGGTSFALLAQGTDGRITSTTFSSSGASFPNDGSLINQYLSIFTGSIYAIYQITAWLSSTSLTIAALTGGTALANQAVDRQYYIGGRWKSPNNPGGATTVRVLSGDTIRVMGTPAPTSLGQNGVWTSQILQATKNISSSTNATPIAVTVTAHGYSTGDTVVITGHTTNTNANGTWEITVTGANTFTLDGSVGNGVGGASGTVRLRNNTRVMLTTAVTQNIASTGPGRAAWTNAMGANGSTALTTAAFKEHNQADRITVNTAFTTGKAAYYTLPSTLDLSGYQQVSFWLATQQGATLSTGQIDLRLCSDTTGDVAVNTLSIPAAPALGRLQPITVDTGAALGNNIQSIALYINTDLSASQTVVLDFNNIIACKASSEPDSLTLTSLIGKNTTGETFWGIQSINGRRVMLDQLVNNTPADGQVLGYYGTSETVTTWKRETYKAGPYANTSTNFCQLVGKSGAELTPIVYSFGWDRTSMSSQTLETWIDGVNGNGQVFSFQGNFQEVRNFAAVRFGSGLSGSFSNYGMVVDCRAMNNGTYTGMNSTSDLYIDFVCASASIGFGDMGNTFFGKVYSSGALTGGAKRFGPGQRGTVDLRNCNATGITFSNPTSGGLLQNSIFQTGTSAFSFTSNHGLLYCRNCLFLDSTEFSLGGAGIGIVTVFSHDHDQVAGNHKIFTNIGNIITATDQRNTASGVSWKMQPLSLHANRNNPLNLSLAKVAVAANSLVTIKAWMRRDNSGLTMRLVCKGGQIAGVANDVTASVTTTNAWEEETITFTPTEAGVVEITAEAWGGTTFSGWVDDMTITQA